LAFHKPVLGRSLLSEQLPTVPARRPTQPVSLAPPAASLYKAPTIPPQPTRTSAREDETRQLSLFHVFAASFTSSSTGLPRVPSGLRLPFLQVVSISKRLLSDCSCSGRQHGRADSALSCCPPDRV